MNLSNPEEGGKLLLIQLAAYYAQTARVGGSALVDVGFAGVVVEVQPFAVFARDYALCEKMSIL